MMRSGRSVVTVGIVAAICGTVLGCSRRAPGPEQCVVFAELHFGYEFETLAGYPEQKAQFDRLVETCLTTPFDRRVIECAQQYRAPLDCLRRIQPDLFGNSEMVPLLRRH
jgi:hypothetical protein